MMIILLKKSCKIWRILMARLARQTMCTAYILVNLWRVHDMNRKAVWTRYSVLILRRQVRKPFCSCFNYFLCFTLSTLFPQGLRKRLAKCCSCPSAVITGIKCDWWSSALLHNDIRLEDCIKLVKNPINFKHCQTLDNESSHDTYEGVCR